MAGNGEPARFVTRVDQNALQQKRREEIGFEKEMSVTRIAKGNGLLPFSVGCEEIAKGWRARADFFKALLRPWADDEREESSRGVCLM